MRCPGFSPLLLVMVEMLLLITTVLGIEQFLQMHVLFTLHRRGVTHVVIPILVCRRGTANAGVFIAIQQHFHLRFGMEFASSYRTTLT